MVNDVAKVTVTVTKGHFAKIGDNETTYFDESIYGRYGMTRFASIMRKRLHDESIVCMSIEYDIHHYTVDVGDLINISLESD